MSREEDAWAVPEPDAGQRVAAAASAGAGAGADTDPLADAVPQATLFGGDPQFPITAPRVREPDRIAWLVAALLVLAAGIVEAAFLFAHTSGTEVRLPLNDSIDLDIDEGSRALMLITIGVLLLLRRTREAASGLALGLAAIWVARYFYMLRPSTLSQGIDTLGVGLFIAAFVLMAAGAVSVLTLTFVRRARATDRQRSRRRQRRPDRIAAVLLGFGGAFLCAIGALLAWVKASIGTTATGVTRTVSCCSWSEDDTWIKTAVVIGGVVIVVLAVFAATIRSKAFAAGVLFGVALLPIVEVLRVIVYGIFPAQSFYGIYASRAIMDITHVSISGDAGFWVGLTGVVLIAAAAVCRLVLGQREDRFQVPELTGAAPIS